METRLRCRPIYSAILCAALCFCSSAYGQDTSNTSNNPKGSGDDYPDVVELDAFGGVSIFGQVSGGLGEKLANGGTVGARLTYNFSRHFGAELDYNFMINNVRLVTPIAPGLPSYIFGNQIQAGAIDLVYSFTPRGSRVQPYLSGGVGVAGFKPTGKAEQEAKARDAIFHSAGLRGTILPALNYGGGIKFHVSEHVGVRFDVRGWWSRNPTFGLPESTSAAVIAPGQNLIANSGGGIYIPSDKNLNGLQATLGIVLYLGRKEVPAPPPPPAPPAPLNAGTITGADGSLCQGRTITLHSTASDPQGHALTYAWTLNGAPSGTNSADLPFTPNNAGDFTVEVTASDSTNPSRSVKAGPVTVTVQAYVAPQVTSISATPDQLSCASDPTGTHTANLSGQATGSCGGNLTYKWTVSEGSVTNDTSANATFDASTLSFEGGAQGQSKTVTATLTVTDETGKSGSQTTNIAVKCPPRFVRLPDIVFAKNNARVNNCGKRILIDEAAPQVASGDYDIVLIGHRDADEEANLPGRGKGRRRAAGHALDEQRVLNSAAVLSGGTGTCAKVDPSRIKVDWVGTDQTSTPQPGLCGTSNRGPQTERRGSSVTEADKNRRVEVYLVPRNSQAQPPAVKNIKPLPEAEVRALGCPK